MVSEPPVVSSTLSQEMPLAAAPLFAMVMVPPAMVTLPSPLMPVAVANLLLEGATEPPSEMVPSL